MGRKKILKLQRKEEREIEAINKKSKKKKVMIGAVLAVVILFAGYQANIALKNKNIQEDFTVLQDYETSETSSQEDSIQENGVNDDNNMNSESLQDGSTQSMEPTDADDTSDIDSQDGSTLTHPYPSQEGNRDNGVSDSENSTQENGANNIAVIETNKGNIKLELYANDAPKTVENFIKLASENFYDGIKFHRVISDFMIQTGDPLSKDDNPANDGTGGPGYSFEDEMNPISLGLDEDTIKLYESQGYKYDYNLNSQKMTVGSLAMANSGPNTNGSQIFIVTEKDQPHLDGKHTVFGKVIEGMDVVTSIEQGDVMSRVYIEE